MNPLDAAFQLPLAKVTPMINRRSIVLGLLAMVAAPAAASARTPDKAFVINPIYLPQSVSYRGDYAPGTVVVDPRQKFLYLVESPDTARRYGVGVGKAGLAWSGVATVARKARWPSWKPTARMIARDPAKYARYAGGLPGGARNPLGSRALYLYRDGMDTYYRIHGTTEPWTIGKAVSNGCIRMVNAHVADLYDRVPLGATVVVLG